MLSTRTRAPSRLLVLWMCMLSCVVYDVLTTSTGHDRWCAVHCQPLVPSRSSKADAARRRLCVSSCVCWVSVSASSRAELSARACCFTGAHWRLCVFVPVRVVFACACVLLLQYARKRKKTRGPARPRCCWVHVSHEWGVCGVSRLATYVVYVRVFGFSRVSTYARPSVDRALHFIVRIWRAIIAPCLSATAAI